MSITVQQVPTGAFALDFVHSRFGFAVRHNCVSIFRSQFRQAEASLVDGVLTGSATVDSIEIALPDLKRRLLSPEFFDATQAPTIAFRSNDIRLADDGTVEVDGELTMRGITRPVIATGTLAVGTSLRGREVVGLDLKATIDRRDYGMNWQGHLPLGGDVLGWAVTLEVGLD